MKIYLLNGQVIFAVTITFDGDTLHYESEEEKGEILLRAIEQIVDAQWEDNQRSR